LTDFITRLSFSICFNPLLSINLVANAILAPIFLHEKITRVDILALFFIIGGCTITVVFGSREDTPRTLEALLFAYTKPAFIIFAIIASGLLILAYVVGVLFVQTITMRFMHRPIAQALLVANDAEEADADAASQLPSSDVDYRPPGLDENGSTRRAEHGDDEPSLQTQSSLLSDSSVTSSSAVAMVHASGPRSVAPSPLFPSESGDGPMAMSMPAIVLPSLSPPANNVLFTRTAATSSPRPSSASRNANETPISIDPAPSAMVISTTRVAPAAALDSVNLGASGVASALARPGTLTDDFPISAADAATIETFTRERSNSLANRSEISHAVRHHLGSILLPAPIYDPIHAAASRISLSTRIRFLAVTYAAFGGALSSVNILMTKIVGELISITSSGENQFRNPLAYVFFGVLIVSNTASIYWMQRALQLFDALIVVPMFQVTFSILSILTGAIYFEEIYSFSALQGGLFPLGVFITILGIWLLSQRESLQGPLTSSSPASSSSSPGGVRVSPSPSGSGAHTPVPSRSRNNSVSDERHASSAELLP
jgi:hypothetical protein